MNDTTGKRYVVGAGDGGEVYLVYHDRPLAAGEREFPGNPKEHVSEKGMAKLQRGGRVIFTPTDQSYAKVAAPLYHD